MATPLRSAEFSRTSVMVSRLTLEAMVVVIYFW